MDKAKILRHALLVISFIAFVLSAYSYYYLAQLETKVLQEEVILVPTGDGKYALMYSAAYYKPLADEWNRKQIIWSLVFGASYIPYARFDLTLKLLEKMGVRLWPGAGTPSGTREV